MEIKMFCNIAFLWGLFLSLHFSFEASTVYWKEGFGGQFPPFVIN